MEVKSSCRVGKWVFPSQEFLRNRGVSTRVFLSVALTGTLGAGIGALLQPEHPVEGALVGGAPVMVICVIVALILRKSGPLAGVDREEVRLYNPEVIGDPVALVTGWGPVVRDWGYNTSRVRRRLRIPIHSRMEVWWGIRGVLELFLATLGFLLLLFGIVIAGGSSGLTPGIFYVPVIGLFLFLVGSFIRFKRARPIIIIDKNCGLIREVPVDGPPQRRVPKPTKERQIEEVHAVQLIDKLWRLSGGGGPQYVLGWEVNLVFIGGGRLNIADCRSLNKARKYSRELSEFLGKPVWESSIPPIRSGSSLAGEKESTRGFKRLVYPRKRTWGAEVERFKARWS